jgi:hypothetical protein
MRHLAQRWFTFQNIGPSPSSGSGHAMVSDGTRVFVLGGSSAGVLADGTILIHALDTSMCFFCRFIWTVYEFETQSASNTRIPTQKLSSPVRRPPNSRGRSPWVPRPRGSHNTQYRLHRMRTQHTVLLLLPPKIWVASPPRRLLASETPVRMVCHLNLRV